jgi:hypothetical protein
MPSTYTPLLTFTVSSAQSSYTFSSIPSTYTDLRIVVFSASSSFDDELLIRFNSVSTTVYSDTILGGNGSTASSNRRTSAAEFHIDNNLAACNGGLYTLDLMNYSNTTTHKTLLARFGRAGTTTGVSANLWRSTDAVNSIYFSLASSLTFGVGSTFTLYGIKAA